MATTLPTISNVITFVTPAVSAICFKTLSMPSICPLYDLMAVGSRWYAVSRRNNAGMPYPDCFVSAFTVMFVLNLFMSFSQIHIVLPVSIPFPIRFLHFTLLLPTHMYLYQVFVPLHHVNTPLAHWFTLPISVLYQVHSSVPHFCLNFHHVHTLLTQSCTSIPL